MDTTWCYSFEDNLFGDPQMELPAWLRIFVVGGYASCLILTIFDGYIFELLCVC